MIDPGLRAAIEAQYDAFRAPPPAAVEGCPCCSSPAELEALVRTPRRELRAEQVEFYAGSALLTVGGVDDLRHLWPRLAELSLTGELLTNPEVVFSKPRRGAWRDWPREEQDALVAIAHAKIEAIARRGADLWWDDEIGEWVCAFAQFMDDVTVLLPPLLRPEPEAASVLLGWHSASAKRLAKGRFGGGFWKDVPENAARVQAWFDRPDVRAALDRALWIAP